MSISASKLQPYEFSFKAMGSPCSLIVYAQSEQSAEHANALSMAELTRFENKYSRYKSDSLISKINHAAGTDKVFELDEETWTLIGYADAAFKQSNGLFDLTSGVLRTVWDFSKKQVPAKEALARVKDKIGWQKLTLNREAFRLPISGMEIDFGGIGKEYAADRVATLLLDNSFYHALIDLGGDIRVTGPHANQQPWMVGISRPDKPGQALATIPLQSGGLASSGNYQRMFELNGKTYSHILNPKTGWPVEGLAGVSVWAPQCLIAGTIATIGMLEGKSKVNKVLNETGLPYLCIDENMQITGSTELITDVKE